MDQAPLEAAHSEAEHVDDRQPREAELLAPTPSVSVADLAARQQAFVVKLVRAIFAVLVTTFTALAIIQALQSDTASSESFGMPTSTWIVASAALFMVALVLAVDRVTRHKKISTVVGAMLGALVGLLATLALGGLMDLLLQSWIGDDRAIEQVRPIALSVKMIMGICLTYLGVVTVLQTKDDFRLVIPYVEFSKQLRGTRAALVDTSVLIDGRIVEVAACNFVQSPLIIPRCVLRELQLLSDSADAMKRAKGRRGLDVVARLQRLGTVDVTIDETFIPGNAVDQMLVEHARSTQAIVLTTDAGLARIAAIQGVRVMNLHELALATRLTLGAGDACTLRVVRAGEQPGQGVGYLPDGTMVVVEDGGGVIGQTVTMTITSALQTSAGRLLFARVGADDEDTGQPGAHEQQTMGVQGTRAEVPLDAQAQHEMNLNDTSDATRGGTASAPAQDAQTQQRAVRSPFPPRPPASMRTGTPRNPRR